MNPIPLDPSEWLPRVLPAGWRISDPHAPAFRRHDGLLVLASVAVEADGKRWLHVSMSRATTLPSWKDYRAVKDLFVGRARKAIQVIPPEDEYINHAEFVLHMFSCLDGDPLPDFRRSFASGVKTL